MKLLFVTTCRVFSLIKEVLGFVNSIIWGERGYNVIVCVQGVGGSAVWVACPFSQNKHWGVEEPLAPVIKPPAPTTTTLWVIPNYVKRGKWCPFEKCS